jgi:hypothetical protein
MRQRPQRHVRVLHGIYLSRYANSVAGAAPAQAAGVISVVQYRHLVALAGTSLAWQLGHVRSRCGSPNTAVPRRRMYARYGTTIR